MAKCQTCRDKDAELLTWWEKTRNWLFLRTNHVFYPQDFDDLKSEQYTKGFSDGVKNGIESERMSYARQKELYSPDPQPLNIEAQVEARLNEMLSVVDPKMVVTFDAKTKQVFIGNELASEGQLMNLKAEAEALSSFQLWGIICESIKALAERAMFIDGENIDTMRKGRSVLYTLSTQKRIVDTFKSVRPVDKVPRQ